MKFNLKMFCIALISAGLVLSACERKPEEAGADASAEAPSEEVDTGEAAPTEEEPAAEADADQADTGAEEQADAADEDAGAEGAAAEQPAEEKKAAAPKTPPVTGNLSSSVGGSGITNGTLKLSVGEDYAVKGSFSGNREDARFMIPLQGKINKQSNAVTLMGDRDGNTARLTGKVSKGGISGKIEGKIHQKPYSSNVNITK